MNSPKGNHIGGGKQSKNIRELLMMVKPAESDRKNKGIIKYFNH